MAQLLECLRMVCPVEAVQSLLVAGIETNYMDRYGNTALHYCTAYHEDSEDTGLEILKLLLRHTKTDVNACNIYGDGRTPLTCFIISTCSVEYVKLLLEFGAKVDSKDSEGNTALHYVPAYDRDQASTIIRLLSKYNVDVNTKNNNGETPLIRYIQRNPDISLIELLIGLGANVHRRDNLGNTALHYCSFYGHNSKFDLNNIVGIIETLITRGIDIDGKNCNRRTPLMSFIIDKCSIELINLLLEKGAKGNVKDCDGNTALHYAVEYNPPYGLDVVCNLLKRNVDVNVTNNYGQTALMTLIKSNPNVHLIKVLIDAGASLSNKDVEGCNLLHYCGALTSSDINSKINKELTDYFHDFKTLFYKETVSVLLANGINVNEKNSKRQTPLMKLIRSKCNIELVKLLLNAGANVNCRDCEGNTALHYVGGYDVNSAVHIVLLFLEYGVNINAKNNDGKTPLMDFIQTKCNIDIIRLLIDRGANVHLVDNCGNNALHYCSSLKCIDLKVIKILLDNEIDVNAQNTMRRTPFMKFVSFGDKMEVLLLLLMAGTDCRSDFEELLSKEVKSRHSENRDLIVFLFKFTLLFDLDLWTSYSSHIRAYKNKQYCNKLKRTVKRFVDELLQMKSFSICDNFTLFDFCSTRNNRKLRFCYRRFLDLDLEQLKHSFPLYFDLIENQIEVAKQWYNVICRLGSVALHSSSKIPLHDVNRVALNSDCLIHISVFLRKQDLINLLKALAV